MTASAVFQLQISIHVYFAYESLWFSPRFTHLIHPQIYIHMARQLHTHTHTHTPPSVYNIRFVYILCSRHSSRFYPFCFFQWKCSPWHWIITIIIIVLLDTIAIVLEHTASVLTLLLLHTYLIYKVHLPLSSATFHHFEAYCSLFMLLLLFALREYTHTHSYTDMRSSGRQAHHSRCSHESHEWSMWPFTEHASSYSFEILQQVSLVL